MHLIGMPGDVAPPSYQLYITLMPPPTQSISVSVKVVDGRHRQDNLYPRNCKALENHPPSRCLHCAPLCADITVVVADALLGAGEVPYLLHMGSTACHAGKLMLSVTGAECD